MTKKLVIGNWKMLPATIAEADEILARIDEWLGDREAPPDIVVCPPFVFIEEVHDRLGEGRLASAVSLGAQDLSLSDAGAQTGEVGGGQLASLGARYVIIGHSERRWKLGESDQVVNAKLKQALRHGLVPVVCLGERTRDGAWQDELTLQISTTFEGVSAPQISKCILAYEPVWAISTNPDAKPDTPASAVRSMSLIRETLADRFMVSQTAFVYGGSVTPSNAADFLARSEIGGVLVGGASVRPDDFLQILSVASQS